MICTISVTVYWKTISAELILENFPELNKYRIENRKDGMLQFKITDCEAFLREMYDTFDEYKFSISYDGKDFVIDIVQK